ncbi:Transcription factor AP-4 [Chionoecetes opilio]|uniref:Transcription factor AP-4 n=1 Tax=Chionoecetes opilio TaxID=41210 RepID=A0A8J8WCC3_CHIOP|nr:Transcription factor AP-4 [Chionoecetes opilio]
MFPRVGEKRRIDDMGFEDEEAIGGLCRLSGRPVSPKSAMEQEKRIRREIANSNERRRMQSINAGFASLKTLLPHHDGEKLSKAAILQQTAEYIYQLEQEKTRLLSQNCQLKRLLNHHQQHHADAEGSPAGGESPCDDGSSGGEVVVSTPVEGGGATEELRREMIELRVQLDRERRHRMSLEEHLRSAETPAPGLPERVKEVTVAHPTTKVEVREAKVEVTPVQTTVPGQVTSVVEVTTTPRVPLPLTTTTTAVKSEPLSPSSKSSNIQLHSSTPVHTVVATTTTSPPTPQAAVTTTTTAATTVIGQPPPQRHHTVLSRQPLNTNGHAQIPGSVVAASPPTTIVTVVPSAKGGIDALPSVFEALTAPGRISGAKVEVEPAPRVPSPETTIEYMDDSKNHTVYIVNSTNAACQKSLDTICEAIRHLEGDHMFQTEDHPRLEEEIITEETLTIEDHVGGDALGEEEPITLHMVGEPQEVPSGAHHHAPPRHAPRPPPTPHHQPQRGGRGPPGGTRCPPAPPGLPGLEGVPVCSISTTTSSPIPATLLQPSRPGVIVVKHP